MNRLAVALGVLVTLAIAAPAAARFTEQPTATAAFTADRLDTPSALTASGSVTVTLTWTPVADVYAAGYRLYRSTISGSGYTLVATISLRTASSTTDTPIVPAQYYYVIRAYAGQWLSPASNEVSVLVL